MINGILSWLRNFKQKRYLADLMKKGFKIGKNCYIMDGIFLDPSHCFLISIGNNCTIAPNVRIIAHDASMRRHLGITKLASVKIHDNCFIGDSAIILPGTSIGPDCVIGAGSVVVRDIPPGSVAAGNPATVIGAYDKFMERHKENSEKNRCFPYKEYDISVISEEKKEEMLEYLKDRIAYIGKTTPDGKKYHKAEQE